MTGIAHSLPSTVTPKCPSLLPPSHWPELSLWAHPEPWRLGNVAIPGGHVPRSNGSSASEREGENLCWVQVAISGTGLLEREPRYPPQTCGWWRRVSSSSQGWILQGKSAHHTHSWWLTQELFFFFLSKRNPSLFKVTECSAKKLNLPVSYDITDMRSLLGD